MSEKHEINEKISRTDSFEDHHGGLTLKHDDEPGTEFTEAETKRVLRKMDLHILPFVSLLYLLSFL